jgi:cyclophilin family peptidyl-prolyl cis-trans isomerase
MDLRMTRMNQIFQRLMVLAVFVATTAAAQQNITLKKRDRKRDVELTTTKGVIVLRLYNQTPLHRDNFLKLVKAHYYDSLLFHRVIKNFMIQGGDPDSRRAAADVPLGNGDPGYTIPAEFVPTLFHKRGVLAAAREGDAINPAKASGGSQFYIVQGRTFTDAGLDSIETFRFKGRKIPPEQRVVYKTLGGTPYLDQNYTVFGEVVRGMEVVDSIASVPTSQQPPDRPLQDVRILKAALVKRKR